MGRQTVNLTPLMKKSSCRVASLLLACIVYTPWLYSQTPDAFDPGAGGPVRALALQPDGKILAAGEFTSLGGQTRKYIGRLNANGSLDTAFVPGGGNSSLWGTDQPVFCAVVQADGKILIGGSFASVGNVARNGLARLNSDGSVDTNFVVTVAGGTVNSLVVQPNGQIVVGGYFSSLGGQPRTCLGRVNRDGTMDTNFTSVANGIVYALALQPDGGILVGGAFSSLGGQALNGIGRLNPDGTCDTNFVASGTSQGLYALAVQPNGQVLVGGYFTSLNGTNYARLARLNANGTLDEAFNPIISSGQVYSLVLQTNGQILVGGYFGAVSGQACTNLARLNADGGLDTSFSPGPAPYFSSSVRSLLVQSDTRILVGGAFSTLAGQPRSNIGRLEADGSVAFSFNPNPNPTSNIYALAYQPDGKLLVGGDFTMMAGVSRKALARLNADGTLDANFNPGVTGTVYCVSVLTNGQILVAGMFTGLAGGSRTSLGRLNTDGSLDTTFNVAIGTSSPEVYCLAVQTNGQILVGGSFSSLGGRPCNGLGRISSTGTLDTSFGASFGWSYGGGPRIYSIVVQPDGKLLIGGAFDSSNGQGRNSLVRLNPNGFTDSTFNPAGYASPGNVNCLALQPNNQVLVGASVNGPPLSRLNADGSLDTNFNATANSSVSALALQADGRILVGGRFSLLGGQTNVCLGRLNADGTADTNFNGGIQASYPWVYALALRADGGIVVGGTFGSLGGQARANLGLLNNTEPATQTLASSGNTITWLRGGTGPELSGATLEACTDGATYFNLGPATRVAAGWQVTGVSLPTNTLIRARGAVSSGQGNGSGGFVESSIAIDPLSPPRIMSTDGSLGFGVNGFGFRLAGLLGQTVVIECSSNLLDWSPLATNAVTISPCSFSDTSGLDSAARFYRVRLQ